MNEYLKNLKRFRPPSRLVQTASHLHHRQRGVDEVYGLCLKAFARLRSCSMLRSLQGPLFSPAQPGYLNAFHLSVSEFWLSPPSGDLYFCSFWRCFFLRLTEMKLNFFTPQV